MKGLYSDAAVEFFMCVCILQANRRHHPQTATVRHTIRAANLYSSAYSHQIFSAE